MRQTILYIAMSLDGFIADSSGGVGWLAGDGSGRAADTYAELMAEADTVLMGWHTYQQVTTELSPDSWPYAGLRCVVFTHREIPAREGVCFTGEPPVSLVRRLREEKGRDIWICGGASVAGQLLEADLVDKLHIAVIPTLLGGGLRLFGPLQAERRLVLLRTIVGDGIAELVYARRQAAARPEEKTGAASPG